ncbi:MAG: hypothetical protein B7Z37_16135 [Verrucomicrobia bacterium 12-59-8]|nr:MAG: hypothetical protein B7Z37_16135 [Verrucomicrobia bacterium 12-59-8]
MKDFFISYNKADKAHALAIKCWLEDAGHTTVMQATDFHAGSNFVLEMDSAAKGAARTLAILSPDYLNSSFTAPEWAAAFVNDPTGRGRKLVPVRVRECAPSGLLQSVVYVDLVGLDMSQAQQKLLSALAGEAVPSPPVKKEKKRSPRQRSEKSESPRISLNAQGETVYQSAGDLYVNPKPPVNKTVFMREPHHVSEAQAAEIRRLLTGLAERDELAGKGKTYGAWMNKFTGKNGFNLTTYKALPASQFEAAVKWIKMQKAVGRSALRRTNNQVWRNDHYAAIWGTAKKMNLDRDAVHQKAREYFGLKKAVESLKEDLGERQLAKFAGFMKREANKAARNKLN